MGHVVSRGSFCRQGPLEEEPVRRSHPRILPQSFLVHESWKVVLSKPDEEMESVVLFVSSRVSLVITSLVRESLQVLLNVTYRWEIGEITAIRLGCGSEVDVEESDNSFEIGANEHVQDKASQQHERLGHTQKDVHVVCSVVLGLTIGECNPQQS